MSTREPVKLDQYPDGCWVACIAMLSGLPHEELAALIPKDIDLAYKNSDYHNAVNTYTREHGWRLSWIGPDAPRGFSIMSGLSPRGHQHAVVALDGEMWHDPHPSRAGLVEPEAFELLIPIVRTLERRR